MNTHKFLNLVMAFVFAFSLLGIPAPVLATSQTSVQSAPFTTCADVTEIPQAECEALTALYNSTNGASWNNNTDWLATNTPCSWYGVGCGERHVSSLNLRENQLTGNIPAELSNLTQLQMLSFADNELAGSIPAVLGNLTQLTWLGLCGNQLSGSIPPELGNLTQLTWFSLCENQLTGNIPAELGNLTQLLRFELFYNQLSGSIPAELGNLTQLERLRLENNQLSGNIPTELGNLTQLHTLELSNNQFTGSIPVELGNLAQLTDLWLEQNQLSGSIPVQLGNLTQLTDFGLGRNQLSGSIPAEFGNLTQLTWLGLCGNQLSGAIPAELGNLRQLTWLGLCDNQLSGSIPTDLGNLTQLTALFLHNTQLSGDFPASITNLVNLTTLTFDCSLTSSDPAVIAFLNEKSPGWQCAANPVIIVRPEDDSVFGSYWPLGTLLMLEIDDPTTPQSPDFTDSRVFAESDDWENGFELEGIFDIQPGQLVTVSGGGSTKQLEVAPLMVTAVDMDADTVSGTGDPGFEIHVGMLCDDNSCTRRNIYVDANGNWLADFSVPGLNEEDETVFDIRPGSGTGVYEIDEDADATSVSWNIPNHTFSVRANNDQVAGSEWILGSTITIEIDDLATQTNPDYSDTATVGLADWDPSQTYFEINTDNYDLKLGDIVTVTDGDITKQLTVTNFVITNVDLDTDTVYGLANPNQLVNIWTCWQSDPCVNRDELADQNGHWVTNFAVPGEQDWEQGISNLQPESWIDSSVSDEDGDSTMFGWWIANPVIVAFLDVDSLGGDDWPRDLAVTMTIDDPNNGSGVDFTDTQMPGDRPWAPNGTWISFDLNGFDLDSGDLVTYDNGQTTKTHTVMNLTITSIDLENDTLSGTADPGAEIQVWVDTPFSSMNRYTTADGNGVWSVDYSIPGASSDAQDIVDITLGTEGQVKAHDQDQDSTQIGWLVSNPILIARLPDNAVNGRDWPLGAAVTLTINDPDIPPAIDFSETRMVEVSEGGPNQTSVWFDLGNFRLEPGQVLNMTDGNVTKVHTVIDLKITEVNINTDAVSGTTNVIPGEIEIYSFGDPWTNRTVNVNPDGTWSADFSVPDGSQSETSDIGPGHEVQANHYDVDGDKTIINWRVPNPVFMLNVYNDSSWQGLDAWNWQLGSQVTLTVDDPGTPQNPDYTEAQTMEPGNDTYHVTHAMYMQDVNFEGHPGFIITLSDGIQTKTMIVPVLHGTEYDLETDTVSGITDPFASVVVACEEGAEPTVIADSNGSWTANFRDPENPDIVIYDIQPGTWCEPQMYDNDWDHIVLRNWSAPSNQAPTANAGPDIDAYIGIAITLNASASSDPEAGLLTYEWDLDNDGQYDDASAMTTAPSFNQVGDHTIGLRVTDEGGLSDTDTATITVLPLTLKGFYQPVDMNGVYNLVKGGSTVPLKFEIFAGSTELTNVADIKSLTYAQTSCDASAITDEIETTATGGTSLRYADGQFIYNWKTPKTAGKCYRVTLTTIDGSVLVAYFKLK